MHTNCPSRLRKKAGDCGTISVRNWTVRPDYPGIKSGHVEEVAEEPVEPLCLALNYIDELVMACVSPAMGEEIHHLLQRAASPCSSAHGWLQPAGIFSCSVARRRQVLTVPAACSRDSSEASRALSEGLPKISEHVRK